VPSSDPFWTAIKADLEGALPRFLLQQRWYPAKDAGEPAVRALEVFSMAGPSQAAVAIWEVMPPRGRPLLMLIPVAAVQTANPDQTIATVRQNGTSYAIVEAITDDDFVRSWITFQVESAEPARLRWRRTDHPLQIDPATAQIRRSRVEQSNTSIRIGEHAIMKVIRKLESGPHPELEIARFLAKVGFSAMPALLGWIELAGHEGRDSYALSLLQQFVPNRGDGWSWTLQQLDRGIISRDLGALEELAKWLDRLAKRTAELHHAFDANTEDPAFRPEPVTVEDFARWEESLKAMAHRVFHSLENSPAQNEEGRQLSAELIKNRERLLNRIAGFKNLPCNFLKTRHHGDFHLGQVLVAGDDAMILDFEGEPLRPLAERLAKHCVLRDVAGAVRSLSYAAAAVERSLSAGKREHVTALEQWRSQAARGFVDSWFAAAQGLRSIPPGRPEAEALLDFFLLEKALYEINYEAANRPDWIAIPLQGALSLLRQERP
jgi:trehalose synthase-fused probable maltokinase